VRPTHCLLFVTLLLGACGVVHAESRIALIIGNGNYDETFLRLENPVNDARAMDSALREAGFDTEVRINVDRVGLYEAVNRFRDKISRDPHAVGLFYFAGHGIQADGTNYLIPVDAHLKSDAELEAKAFDAAKVLRAMEGAQNDMNIVIFDACRDNPLPKSRGAERGLARMFAASGTFIAYAAAPGQVAHDGARGTNGVFTGEFIKAMAEPGQPLEQMFKKVIAGVRRDTNGSQQPWSESSIQGDFFFRQATKAASVPATPASDPQVVAPPPVAQPKPRTAAAPKSGSANVQKPIPNPSSAVTSAETERCRQAREKAQLGEIDEATMDVIKNCANK
jgi:uncharacterized caspase-like protein